MIILASYQDKPLTFRDDGWFNMTKAAKAFGKKLSHFFENEETGRYMQALRKLPGIPGSLVCTTVGRNGGTWAHPKLAVKFARWCDVDFEVWCDAQIEKIVRGGDGVMLHMVMTHYWEQAMRLERDDARSFAAASLGSKAMLVRKKVLPKIRRDRQQLLLDMQPVLFEQEA